MKKRYHISKETKLLAQASVLASMLRSEDAFMLATEELETTDFSFEYSLLFRALKDIPYSALKQLWAVVDEVCVPKNTDVYIRLMKGE